jgi:hypothetical protein
MSEDAFSTLKKLQNGKSLCFFAMTLLILATAAPIFITSVRAPTGENPYVPGGVPENTVQYNKTDTTPLAEMMQLKASEPVLFRYRNMTLLMNCTQNCEIVFTADPEVTPKIFGFLIAPNQTMELTMNLSGSPFEGERVIERTLNFYLGMEPNATLQLNAQIRLHINQTELSQELNREVNVSRLTWMYWNRTQGDWEAVESHFDEDGFLACETDHFSTWTVAEMEPEEAMKFALDMVFVYAAVSVTIVAILAISIVALKRRS